MDIEHYYTEKGSGETLILLHGNGENSDYFSKQIEEFSKFFRVIALDTRGHGRTPRGGGEFTIRRFADDLNLFMERLGIEKANILGFSDGGNIALVFALKYPERVDKLIVDGANLFPKGVKSRFQVPVELAYRIASIFKSSEKARAKAEMLGLMVNDPFIKPESLRNIGAKTLVMAGTNDLIKEEHTRLIASMIPDNRLEFVKGDHFIASKTPTEFNKTVLKFLTENKNGSN